MGNRHLHKLQKQPACSSMNTETGESFNKRQAVASLDAAGFPPPQCSGYYVARITFQVSLGMGLGTVICHVLHLEI